MLRRRFDERQVGHGGTLDPSATGVLVVAVGKATKLLRFVEKTSKAYVGEIVFGTETDTLDADGEVTATHEMGDIDLADGAGGCRRAPARRHRADSADGVGDQDRRQAAARTRPRGDRGRATAATGDDPLVLADADRRAARAARGGRVQFGHLRPNARRRSRSPARRGCASPQPAPNCGRVASRSARRQAPTSACCCPSRRRCARSTAST